MSSRFQPAILSAVPPVGTVLVFDMEPGTDPRPALDVLRVPSARMTVGIGEPLALALTPRVPGLRSFGGVTGAGMSFPSIQGALWISIGGDERGEVLDLAIQLRRKMKGFRLLEEVDTFRYRGGRDLTGYEDGTENPTGDAAIEAAFTKEGGSFVAVQKYVHDLETFTGFEVKARDAIIGRSFDTNDEIPDAVSSAHVKRSAQESFDPPAFMVRRSMPWGTVSEHGLYFVAFVSELDKFERVLRRMAGLEDSVVDGLLSITRAVSGGYYYCPPLENGALDLRVLGL